jgi:tetratricopeptide (TPR) repeat protein
VYKVPTNSREIDALNKEIRGVQKDIADRQNRNREVTSAQYSVQANNYQKLFNLTKDKKELSNAIDFITKAIVKSPEAQYLAKRAELYSKNEEFDKAARDISKLSELGPISGIAGIYVNKVVKDISTLNEIQYQISLLLITGEISQELADVLSDHAKITQNLVLKVGAHDERLDGHDEQIEVLKDQLKKSQYQITQVMILISEGKTLTEEQIKELKRVQEEGEKKLGIVARKVDDLELKVDTVEDKVYRVEDKVVALQDSNSMIEVCVQSLNANAGTHQIIESINYLKSKQDYLSGLITNQDAFGIDLKTKIEKLSKNSDPELLESICKQVAEHEKILEVSGVKAKAEIEEFLKILEKDDPKLLDYFKTFYWTTLNLFDAFRVLSTNYVEKNTNAVFSKKATAAMLAQEKAFKLGAELTNGIPVIGTIMSLLNTVNRESVYTVKYRAFVNQVNSINQIIFSSMLNEDEISINIAQAAIKIINAKKAEIIEPREKTITIGGKIQNLLNWIQNTINDGKSAILNLPDEVELNRDDPQVKLALEDVSLMMAYLYTHYEEKPSQLTEKMTEIVLKHSAELALQDILKDKTPDQIAELVTKHSKVSESEHKKSQNILLK